MHIFRIIIVEKRTWFLFFLAICQTLQLYTVCDNTCDSSVQVYLSCTESCHNWLKDQPTVTQMKMPEYINHTSSKFVSYLLWQTYRFGSARSCPVQSVYVFAVIIGAFKSDSLQSTLLRQLPTNCTGCTGQDWFIFLQAKETCCDAYQTSLWRLVFWKLCACVRWYVRVLSSHVRHDSSLQYACLSVRRDAWR